MPAAPTPLTTRPAMSMFTLEDTPHTSEPASKMKMLMRRTYFAGNMRIIWPKKRMKTVSERTNELATQPCRAKASKSCGKSVSETRYWVPHQDEPMLSEVKRLLNA